MLLEQALEYQAKGWSVMPLQPRSKRPMLASWKHLQEQPADQATIRQWWTEQPDANIAILTGRVSGLVVADFDNCTRDPEAVLTDLNIGADIPIAETAKGFHAYFRHPGGEVRNGVRVGYVGETGIDIRGDGGYVAAPPSVHETGVLYEWHSQGPLSLLPEAFRRGALPTAAPITAAGIVGEVAELDRLLNGVGSGERNHAAAKIAGHFLRLCKVESAAWEAVRLWNRQNTPPLSDYELRATFDSIARRNRMSPDGDCESDPRSDGVPASASVAPRLRLYSGTEWANSVRHAPPRHGVQAPSWPGLEEVGGLVPKDLLILAGRPGMGKSTAAWGVALDAAIRQHLPTIVFSTEMTMSDVARWIGSMAFKRDQRDLTPKQWDATLQALSKSPITICDAGTVSVKEIDAIVRGRPETKLVIIDHMQRLVWGEHRNTAIEAGAAMLKSLAKDEDLTVLALSQLNRSSSYEKRQPNLHDLRDSGGLEQEADAVCFLWTDADDITQVELPVKFWWAKNRHGYMKQIDATFYKVSKRYVPMDGGDAIRQKQLQAQHTERLHEMQLSGRDRAAGES